MTEVESNEYISREQIVSERKEKATADFNLLMSEKSLEIPSSDEELGSLSYWFNLAEKLKGVKEVVVKYNERGDEALDIYNELENKGKVKRSQVENFYNSWNKFLVDNKKAEAERLSEVAAGVYDKKEE